MLIAALQVAGTLQSFGGFVGGFCGALLGIWVTRHRSERTRGR